LEKIKIAKKEVEWLHKTKKLPHQRSLKSRELQQRASKQALLLVTHFNQTCPSRQMFCQIWIKTLICDCILGWWFDKMHLGIEREKEAPKLVHFIRRHRTFTNQPRVVLSTLRIKASGRPRSGILLSMLL
jgi:hypothetical protein